MFVWLVFVMENTLSSGSEEPVSCCQHQAWLCGNVKYFWWGQNMACSPRVGSEHDQKRVSSQTCMMGMGVACVFGPHLHTSSRPASHNALLFLCIIESPTGILKRRRGLAIKGSGVVRSTGVTSKTLLKNWSGGFVAKVDLSLGPFHQLHNTEQKKTTCFMWQTGRRHLHSVFSSFLPQMLIFLPI